jgi:hypothetical protein
MQSQPSGLIAEYLEAAKEEREAWKALAECTRSTADCTQAFQRWKRATEVSRDIAVRWRSAIGARRDSPSE